MTQQAWSTRCCRLGEDLLMLGRKYIHLSPDDSSGNSGRFKFFHLLLEWVNGSTSSGSDLNNAGPQTPSQIIRWGWCTPSDSGIAPPWHGARLDGCAWSQGRQTHVAGFKLHNDGADNRRQTWCRVRWSGGHITMRSAHRVSGVVPVQY